jgi:hypothetical protein
LEALFRSKPSTIFWVRLFALSDCLPKIIPSPSCAYPHADSKSGIVQIVLVIPSAMQGDMLIAVFTLAKFYHATQMAQHAL